MSEENKVNAVSLKLPTFWIEEPEVWFAQVDAQFAIRNITVTDTKYHYAVAALDQTTARRVLDILRTPPGGDKYQALKDRLLGTYALSEDERAARLLNQPGLGDKRPSALMDEMLALLGDHSPCFLFRRLFLQQLPEDIRGHILQAGLQDPREMAKMADRLWTNRTEAYPVTRTTSQTPVFKSIKTAEKKNASTGFC